MDTGDIFRRLFGFPIPEHHMPRPQRPEGEFFSREEEPAFFHSFHFGDMQEAEDFFDRCFRDMEKAFTQMPGFHKDFEFKSFFDGALEPSRERVVPDPRQEMLKDPDTSREPKPGLQFPAQKSPSKDSDLDVEVRERGLDAILPAQPRQDRGRGLWSGPGFSFFGGANMGPFSSDHAQHDQFQFESTEIQIQDGQVNKVKESHYMRVDEEGREVRTVVREKDGVRQVLTTTRDRQGREQTIEYKQPLSDSPDSVISRPDKPMLLPPPSSDSPAPQPQPSLLRKLFSFFRADA